MSNNSNEPRFRLLPFVIGLAVLAFGAHLLGFVHDVRAMEGDSSVNKEDAKPVEGVLISDDDKKKGEADEKGMQTLEPARVPAQGWRDAIDEDVGGGETKQAVAQDLVARAAALDKREAELDTKQATLVAAMKALDEKYQRLTKLSAQVSVGVKSNDTAHDVQIARLVKIYEGMKAKDAARLFDGQDMDLLVDVMSRMSERKLSPIMAAMNPDRARELTVMLSQATPPPTTDAK